MKRAERGGIFFRLLSLLAFLAVLAFFYVIRRPLMRIAGEYWVADEPADHADVIIVLGDDNYTGDRAAHAADLYHAGWAPQVVASGRFLRPYAEIAGMIEHDLESRGVPAASIIKFAHRAANTREEAEALIGLAASHGWKRVLVVTSNYHSRRARFIFGRVFPPTVTVHVSAAPDSEFDPVRWWGTRLGQKLFFIEVVGYVAAWWELRKGPSTVPRATLEFLEPGYQAWLSPSGTALPLAPPVSDWKHTRFTEILPRTIVRTLPSSPGSLRSPRPSGYGVSVGGIHVA